MTDVEAIVAELEKFSPAICERGNPVNLVLVAAFERAAGLPLPADYWAVMACADPMSQLRWDPSTAGSIWQYMAFL